MSFCLHKLCSYPLIAIRRTENIGDIQPHPSFCLTTIEFWKFINGDWNSGYKWLNVYGELVTDVGGNLLRALEQKGIEWYPMLRSNKRNLHPLFFGIYEDLIYHHGAGYRNPLSRTDKCKYNYSRSTRLIHRILKKLHMPRSFLTRISPLEYKRRKIMTDNYILQQKVYKMIREDPLFFHYFIEPC